MLESSKFILDKTQNIKPDIAIILGSGLTNFFDDQDITYSFSYESLIDFPKTTVKGHFGKCISVKPNNVINFFGIFFLK